MNVLSALHSSNVTFPFKLPYLLMIVAFCFLQFYTSVNETENQSGKWVCASLLPYCYTGTPAVPAGL